MLDFKENGAHNGDMRAVFLLSLSFMHVYAHADIIYSCDLDDNTRIQLSHEQRDWKYRSFYIPTGEKLWEISHKKVPFYTARNITRNDNTMTYNDISTLRFNYKNINYIVFNEFLQNKKTIQNNEGLLVLTSHQQRRFNCKKKDINRLHSVLTSFQCDRKIKNTKHENVCK